MADDVPLSLVIRFRGAGWRYPFTVGDAVEVWRGQECLGEIPAVLVTHVLAHHVQGALLAARVQEALKNPALGPIVLPVRPAPPSPRLRGATGRRLLGRGEP